jgi:hypothetical protein
MLALSENFITADDDLETTLARVTNAVVDLIDGIGYADLMLALDGELLSVAPTDPFVADLDALQMQLEKGRARRQRSMTRLFGATTFSRMSGGPRSPVPRWRPGSAAFCRISCPRIAVAPALLIPSVLNRAPWMLTAKRSAPCSPPTLRV